MSPVEALLSLDRLRLGSTRSLLGSALSNARRSLAEIGAAVDDRRQLLRDLEEAAVPGDLLALSPGTCLELLATRRVGRLAYVARAGVPDIVPVNYSLRDGAILIRSGPGPKLQAAERRDRVAFEVDDVHEATHTGWSVVVLGRADRLSAAEAARLEDHEPWANGARRHTLRLRPERISGRQLL